MYEKEAQNKSAQPPCADANISFAIVAMSG
jgi:hypothetical protein